MNDKKIRKNLPFFDFVTTSHTVMSVSKNLLTLKEKVDNFMPYGFRKYPKVVVVDFSWALIHSVLGVFSKLSINQYLGIFNNFQYI